MKILYLVHQFFPKHYTGTERFTLDLAKQMQRMGHYPTVLTYEPSPEVDGFKKLTDKMLFKRYSYHSIPVFALRHAGPADISSVFDPAIEEAFKKLGLECDLVHICHPMWLSSSARVCKTAGIPVVMTLTDAWLLCPRTLIDSGFRLCDGPESDEQCMSLCKLKTKRRYEDAKLLYYMVDEVTAASRFLPTLFERNGWNRRFRTIPHSIDYRYVRRSRTPPEKKITFAFIGSLAWHKGAHVLINAFRAVLRGNIALKIYGSPHEQREYFQALLDLAQGDSRIQFLDPFKIENLADIMSNVSVIVIPSVYYENYPLVMLIALAYKVPVIASKIGGMPEVIKQGFNGFLFETGESKELASIITRIAQEPEILGNLRTNITAPRRIEEEALDYENIYRDLIRFSSSVCSSCETPLH